MAAAANTFIKKCEQKTEALSLRPVEGTCVCGLVLASVITFQANVAAKAQVDGNASLDFANALNLHRAEASKSLLPS